MNRFFILNRKFTVVKQDIKNPVDKLLFLSQGLGLAGLALVKIFLVLVIYLSQDWKMAWLFYIYVLLDLPVKILFPPPPLLWVKHLIRILLSKTELWRFLMRLLLWDVTVLLLIGWMILGIIVFPNYFEMFPFLFIPFALSLLNSLLAFILLLFFQQARMAVFFSILLFVLALSAINMQEINLMLFSLTTCLFAQLLLFTYLVKKEMFVI